MSEFYYDDNWVKKPKRELTPKAIANALINLPALDRDYLIKGKISISTFRRWITRNVRLGKKIIAIREGRENLSDYARLELEG